MYTLCNTLLFVHFRTCAFRYFRHLFSGVHRCSKLDFTRIGILGLKTNHLATLIRSKNGLGLQLKNWAQIFLQNETLKVAAPIFAV
jgi:hypothetical protein